MRFAALAAQPLARRGRRLNNVFCVKPASAGQWFVGESVEGAMLSEVMANVTAGSACLVARDLVTILVALERANCVHGHLTSDNVVIDTKGMVWLADFELACRVGDRAKDAPNLPALPRDDMLAMGLVFGEVFSKVSETHPNAWNTASEDSQAFDSLRFFSHAMTEHDPRQRPTSTDLASKVSKLKFDDELARAQLAFSSSKVLNRHSGIETSVFANSELNIRDSDHWHSDELALKLFSLAALIVSGILAYAPALF